MASGTCTLNSGTSVSSGGNSGYSLASGTTANTASGPWSASPGYPYKITAVSVPWFGYSAGSSNITVNGTVTVSIGSSTLTGTLSSTTLKTNTNVTGTISCTGTINLTSGTDYTIKVTCSGSNLLKTGVRFVTNAKKLTVTYSARTYTIAYNANGHGTAPSSQTKTAGTALTLRSFISDVNGSDNTVTITGNKNGGTWSGSNGSAKWHYVYSQTKWNTASDGSGTNYNSGSSYTANAAATMYAQWSSTKTGSSYTLPTGTPTHSNTTTNTLTVTFNANGGSTTKTSQTSSKTVTYSFKGWYTASSGGTKRTTSSRVTAAETVYAQFDTTTGSQAAVTLPTTSQCTRTGYTLLGFATSSTATTAAYNAGASYTPSATIILYAVWKPITYSISYSLGDGYFPSGTQTTYVSGSWTYPRNPTSLAYDNSNFTAEAGTSMNTGFTLDTPQRVGYTFLGWTITNLTSATAAYWDKDLDPAAWHTPASGTSWDTSTFNPINPVLRYLRSTAGTVTFTAQWSSKNSYTLTLNANGGTCSEASRTVQYAANIDNLPIPTKNGYAFKGWYHTYDGTTYARWGRDTRYTDYFSFHCRARMDDWSELVTGAMKIVSSTQNGGWALGRSSSNVDVAVIQYAVWGSTGAAYVRADSTILWKNLDPGWHTFDMIFTGSAINGYLDGTQVATATFSDTLTYHATNGIFIGAEPGNSPYTPEGGFFIGDLANFTVRHNTNLIAENNFQVLTMPGHNLTLVALWEQIPSYIKVYTSNGWQEIELQHYDNVSGDFQKSPVKVYTSSGWQTVQS